MCQALGGFAVGEHCLSQKDIIAIFDVVGYEYRPKQDDFYDVNCLGDEQDCTLTKHNISFVKDINGDNTPEVLITDSNVFKYGATGTGFSLLSQNKSGYQVLIGEMAGIYQPLSTRGKNGYPDVMVGGRGFCFGVWRYDGKQYTLNRHATFDGKVCTLDNIGSSHAIDR